MDEENRLKPIAEGYRTLNREPRNESPLLAFTLTPVEKSLAMEPLLDKQEWFDEQNPKLITEEMLRELPGTTPATLARYIEAQNQFNNHPEASRRINEKMNPFRSNVLFAIITPATEVFKTGDLSPKYKEKAKQILGNSLPEIVECIAQFTERTAQKKSLSHAYPRVVDAILSEKESPSPNINKIGEFEELAKKIREDSINKRDEVEQIFALGKLTSYVIREAENMPHDEVDIPKLVEDILKEKKSTQLLDFDKVFANIRQKYSAE